jgi:hypothetical protein
MNLRRTERLLERLARRAASRHPMSRRQLVRPNGIPGSAGPPRLDGIARALAAEPVSRRGLLGGGAVAAAALALGARPPLAGAITCGTGTMFCPDPGGGHCCPTGPDTGPCCGDQGLGHPCCIPGYVCCGGILCCEPGKICCVGPTGGGNYGGSCCEPGTPCNGVYCGSPLTADAGGSYSVKRGGTVHLDGSGSAPADKITSYRWSFEPNGECSGGVSAKAGNKTGKTASAVILCPVKVTLTVSDGQNTATDTATVDVEARELHKIPFNQVDEGDADTATFPFQAGVLVFGYNRCRVEWNKTNDPDKADHWLHPGADPKGDKNSLDRAQVNDRGGPFNDVWYVKDHNLKVTRMLIVNRKISAGGVVWDINDSHKHRKAIKRIRAATLDHERLHGVLVEDEMKSDGFDLVKTLEKEVAKSEDKLLDRTNFLIRDAETELKGASSEGKVQQRMKKIYGKEEVTILVEGSNSVYGPQPFTLATIGDK